MLVLFIILKVFFPLSGVYEMVQQSLPAAFRQGVEFK